MGASVKSAFAHIYTVLQPHVVITHESRDEPFLNSGIRLRAAQADITHIGLRGRVSSFKWITKLDSKALAGTISLSMTLLALQYFNM